MKQEMSFDFESFKSLIPYYLVEDPKKKAFVEELRKLAEGAKSGYIVDTDNDKDLSTMLQGDGWNQLQLYSFSRKSEFRIRGIILSNSCDVSTENARALPPRVTFAPLIKLSKVKKRFEDRGLAREQIDSKIISIRSQHTTNIFYLPPEGPLDEEYIALMDDVHSIPLEDCLQSSSKFFTLSMAAFYLFIFKVSIHFCRVHENWERKL